MPGPRLLSATSRIRLTAKNLSARMAPRTRTAEIPILIVGAGPVGLALAADLGQRGVPCLVIEQGEGPPTTPAPPPQCRSMEFMRRFGVAEAVRAASAPEDFPHTALYCTSLNGFEIARIERPHHGGRGATRRAPSGPSAATSSGSIRSCAISPWPKPAWSCATAAGSKPCGRRATASSSPPKIWQMIRRATAHRIVAQYVVDCSGGHSPIRRDLRIGMSGSSYVGHNLSIFVRAPRLWKHHPWARPR